MSSEPAPSRCRQCGSRLRPDDEWCSLCLAPVRVPVEPVLPPAPRAAHQPEPVRIPAGQQAGAVRPEATAALDPAAEPVDADSPDPVSSLDPVPPLDRSRAPVDPEVIAVADRMLAELALASAVERNTGLHRLLARTAARTGLTPTGAGLVLAAAGAGVFLVVLIVVLTLVGLVT